MPLRHMRHIGQVLDQARELRHLPLDHCVRRARERLVVFRDPQHVHGAAHGGQGIAHLVGQGRKEILSVRFTFTKLQGELIALRDNRLQARLQIALRARGFLGCHRALALG